MTIYHPLPCAVNLFIAAFITLVNVVLEPPIIGQKPNTIAI